MSIEANTSYLYATGSGIAIQITGSTALSMNVSGNVTRPGFFQIMFDACGGTNTWVSITPTDTWNAIVYGVVGTNQGGAYSGVTGRFTAPIAGLYLFSAGAYCYNNYVHPVFLVNGSISAKRAGVGYYLRLRGHGHVAGGYSHDTQISETMYLAAGDYVQVGLYGSGGGGVIPGYYGTYSNFSGVLLG